MNIKDIKEIKNILQNQIVTFTVRGTTSYCKGSDDNWGQNSTKFKTNIDRKGIVASISIDEFCGTSMNVNKFGPTCVTLYTFDMLSNKTTGKIKYEDITIIDLVGVIV